MSNGETFLLIFTILQLPSDPRAPRLSRSPRLNQKVAICHRGALPPSSRPWGRAESRRATTLIPTLPRMGSCLIQTDLEFLLQRPPGKTPRFHTKQWIVWTKTLTCSWSWTPHWLLQATSTWKRYPAMRHLGKTWSCLVKRMVRITFPPSVNLNGVVFFSSGFQLYKHLLNRLYLMALHWFDFYMESSVNSSIFLPVRRSSVVYWTIHFFLRLLAALHS